MTNDHYFTESPSSDIKLFQIKCTLRNFPFSFTTSSGIFSPKRIDPGTALLIQNAIIPRNGKILDIGTGYGVIGVVLATVCPKCRVLMTEINERAVWLAKENVRRSGVKNAAVLKSNFYNSIKETDFDLIISNPPLKLGHDPIFMFISESYKFLAQGGSLQLVIRKNHVRIISHVSDVFSDVKVLASKKGYKVISARKK
ncbi:MAG: class I SAM-dependent methyltransferase [Candidatus Helarchaeota archaeon]